MAYEVIFYPSANNHGLKWNSAHKVDADRLSKLLADARLVGLNDYVLLRVRA